MTLEEYSIVISANAESAAKGLDSMIGSLSQLEQKLAPIVSLLSQLAAALEKIAQFANDSDFGKVGQAAGAYERAKNAGRGAIEKSERPDAEYAREFAANTTPGELLRMREEGAVQGLQNALAGDKNGDLNMTAVARGIASVQKYAQAIAEAGQAVAGTREQFGLFARAAMSLDRGIGKIEKGFSRFNRLLSTMLMRTAIRALIKSFSEAWNAMYKFSQAGDGKFAASVERMRGAVAGAASNILTSFAPAIEAVIPIINVISSAIAGLCNVIQWLLSLLGATSSFFGVSAEALDKYSQSAGGGSAANKGLLASFDELNVIQNAGGGGGGGGGGGAKNFGSDLVGEEMARIKLIAGESMLAIGLLLTCLGHASLGVPLILLGVGSIVNAVTQDFGGASAEVQKEMLKIMTIAGVSMVGIGLLMMTFGHVGWGIAFIAAGAANLIGAGVAAGSNGLAEVQEWIGKILAIAGASMVALGVILLCFGVIPQGLGLLVAGAASLAGAVAANPNGFKSVLDFITSSFNLIKSVVESAWESVCKFFDDNIIEPIRTAWKLVAPFFETLFGTIGSAISDAWEAVKNFFKDPIGSIKSAWEGTKKFFSDLFTSIGTWAINAYNDAKNWWNTNVTANVEKEGAWGGVKGFFTGLWNGVKSAAEGAWNTVNNWLDENVPQNIKDVWNVFKTTISTVFKTVKSSITAAWTQVQKWWGNFTGSLTTTWETVKKLIAPVWDTIRSKIVSAWTQVQKWWSNFTTNLETAWKSVKTIIAPVWDTIKSKITAAWTQLVKWWGNFATNLSQKWDKVKQIIGLVWDTVKSKITAAWTQFQKWWGEFATNLSQKWDKVKQIIGLVWDTIKSKITAAWTQVQKWWGNFTNTLSKTWSLVKSIIVPVWDEIKSKITAAWTQLQKWWGNFTASLSEKWEIVKKTISIVWDTVKSKITAAWTQFKEWWKDKTGTLSLAWNSVKTLLGGVWDNIKSKISGAWTQFKEWWKDKTGTLSLAWNSVKTLLGGVWDNIKSKISGAWTQFKEWWHDKSSRISLAWNSVKTILGGVWDGIGSSISGAWNSVQEWWNTNISSKIDGAWNTVNEVFQKAFSPLRDAVNWLRELLGIPSAEFTYYVNVVERKGTITAPETTGTSPGGYLVGGSTSKDLSKLVYSGIENLFHANGAYDIPSGDLFIANEAGAELVGSINGRTSVANQDQIIEGIRKGVRDANTEQNTLLRQQNALLQRLLDKEVVARVEASVGLGREVNKSLRMYDRVAGG